MVEGVGVACHLVNRSPSSVLVEKTTHEVWTGKKQSLDHIKVFGCDAYVHVPNKNRNKMDNKVENNIFIGHKYSMKG
jgi:hypothetical protein